MFNKKPKNVNGVLAIFTKAISDLEDVERENTQMSANCFDEAEALQRTATEHADEARRAATIRDNLSKIVQAH